MFFFLVKWIVNLNSTRAMLGAQASANEKLRVSTSSFIPLLRLKEATIQIWT
jgi:hypothetical protein